MKKFSLEWPSHIFVVLQTLQDFTYIAFKDLLCGNCIVLAMHHIESNSFETFHASSNYFLFIRKVILGHLWCTTMRLLEIACDSNILPLSFLSLNFWKFQKSNKIAWNFAQMTEPVVVDEKGLFGVLAIHHIESNSFETFYASSNHCLFMRKLTLGHLWCMTERLLEIACDSNIFPLPFLSLNFWKFQKSNKIAWNFAQVTRSCCC